MCSLRYNGHSIGYRYGPGSGRIMMYDVRCTGREIYFTQCRQRQRNTCDHSKDVSISCGIGSILGQYFAASLPSFSCFSAVFCLYSIIIIDNSVTLRSIKLRPFVFFTARCTMCIARYWDRMSSVRLSVCPSVRLSVTCRYRDHIGWNSSKIISRPNSLGPMWGVPTTWAIWCEGNTPKIGVE